MTSSKKRGSLITISQLFIFCLCYFSPILDIKIFSTVEPQLVPPIKLIMLYYYFHCMSIFGLSTGLRWMLLSSALIHFSCCSFIACLHDGFTPCARVKKNLKQWNLFDLPLLFHQGFALSTRAYVLSCRFMQCSVIASDPGTIWNFS